MPNLVKVSRALIRAMLASHVCSQTHQNQIQHASGPSFTRLGGGDKVRASILYVGAAVGFAVALKGQMNLWFGTGKIERN